MYPRRPPCDCGNPALRSGQCTRCEFLDGPIDATKAYCAPTIIATLRLHGALTLTQISDELRTDPETVQRVLHRMARLGRVGRHVDPSTYGWTYHLTSPKEHAV